MVFKTTYNRAVETQNLSKGDIRMFKIFIDSGGNVPAVICKKYDIEVLSFTELVDGKEIKCYNPDLLPLEERLEGAKFYEAMRKGAKVSTTLLNTVELRDSFEPYVKDGFDVLYICISSGISGTYNSARLAAEELMEDYAERKVRIIDSKNASLGAGLQAVKASMMRSEGADIDAVAAKIEKDVPKMNGLFTVGNLKYLAKTGRIKSSVAFAGNVLNIKPILRGDKDGFIVEVEKVRGRRKSLETICSYLVNNIEHPEEQIIGIAHADAYEEALECAKVIRNNVKVKDVIITSYDLCTGSHVGPDTIALFFLAKDRELQAATDVGHKNLRFSDI